MRGSVPGVYAAQSVVLLPRETKTSPHPHFASEEAEAQEGQGPRPRPHSWDSSPLLPRGL